MRRTKIVATIGPASRDPLVLERLVRAGVDVLRLNFSHGTHEDHARVVGTAREIAGRLERPLALLQDLSGPKIRTGPMAGGEIELRDGARLAITTDELAEGTPELISTTYEALPRDVKEGDRILLDDGNLELRVLAVSGVRVECEIVDGGPLRSNKGMNLPGVRLSAPALTDKDRRDLAFGLEQGVDYVALSFVRQAADVEELKELMRSLGHDVPVIAKIEKPAAVENLASILEIADGVMVARGDLGVEIGTEEVPTVQKKIIAAANIAGRVVITATQMLESMIDNPRPTRAEASDVANAILDGTDAVMLSGESAVGRFPVQTVETMARIADYTEEHAVNRTADRVCHGRGTAITRSLARVAASVAEELGCKMIMALTDSGVTAQLASGFRPRVPVVAVTGDDAVCRRLALWWGVLPVRRRDAVSSDDLQASAEARLKALGLAGKGDTVLILSGHSDLAAATNMLRVHEVS
ncbi:MAG: pyruvate kinase [Acidobacteria bacterium]|jgi:pyruvate kinase|nr:pyruvate kinase [Acidobacteriota bacterium]